MKLSDRAAGAVMGALIGSTYSLSRRLQSVRRTANAIKYAVAAGAKVINLSMSGQTSSDIRDAVHQATIAPLPFYTPSKGGRS